jgi:uncharacterized membrane protein YtjA (UPF0391 family)
MINLILILLILALVLPLFGVYVVAGTVGILLKILLIILVVGFIINLANGNRSFWF